MIYVPESGRGIYYTLVLSNSQDVRHSNEIRQRRCSHLAHDMCTMNLYCELGYIQFGRNLLVQETGYDLAHYFPLALGQRIVSIPQVTNFGAALAGKPITLDSLVDRPQQFVLLERLGQKFSCPRFHCLHGCWDVAVTR